jgi:lipopolysaccharide export LptBFGC system permease protein LptF
MAFAVASVPMAIVDPRSRRSGGFVRAIFLVIAYYLVWIGFNDLAYSGNAPSAVLVIPPFLILTYGVMRIWSANSDISSLWQLIRRARELRRKN